MKKPSLLKNFNWLLLINLIAICLIGLLNLYSASIAKNSNLYIHQLYYFLLNIPLMTIVMAVDYRLLDRFAYFIYLLAIFLLILVLFKGKVVGGSQRWLDLKVVSFQPSEFAKVAVIIALAHYFHHHKSRGSYNLRELVKPFILIAIPVTLILKEPDLGTGILVFAIAISMVLFVRVRLYSLLQLAILGLAGSAVAWFWVLKAYQKRRIFAFLNPGGDLLGANYHSRQSMIAVGSGKFWGKGLTEGTQTQLRFLPEQHTDFIFSVWAEEWGFLGATLLLLLFLTLITQIIYVGRNARDKFGILLCVGIAAMVFWHLIVNICMVTRLIPVVGVTLPFMSYGGSSLTMFLLLIALCLNISCRKNIF